MPNLDLDETLQSVMEFESKLFGEEDDAKLLAYLTELKTAEQGHAGEVKAAVDKLEEYRRTATGTGMMGKDETDRAVLIAEIFTAMLASSPVAMVAETIKALKASDEAPGIAELEQLKDMMVGGLTSAEVESLQTSDGDVFVDASATTTGAPDFVIDSIMGFAGGAGTTTTEAPEFDANVKHAGAVPGSETANDDTSTTVSSTSTSTSTSSSTASSSTSSSSTTSSSTSSSSTASSSTSSSSTSTAAPPTAAPTTASPTTDAEASMAAEASVLQSKDEGDNAGSNNNDNDDFLIPIIAAASALAGVFVTVGAIVVVRRRRRSVTDIDFQPNLAHQIPRVSVSAVYESQA